jgi:hypothetical protein
LYLYDFKYKWPKFDLVIFANAYLLLLVMCQTCEAVCKKSDPPYSLYTMISLTGWGGQLWTVFWGPLPLPLGPVSGKISENQWAAD